MLTNAAAMVNAQSVCSDLQIEHVWYAAFDSTAVEVLVTNTGGVGFTSPEFALVNTALDTIAREPFDFFVMPTGEQTHTMQLMPGMAMPDDPFTGELVLHYNVQGGEAVCTFPLSGAQLCPPGPCQELYLQILPIDTLVISLLYWWVEDEGSNTVVNGEELLDPTGQVIGSDTMCLPPGRYALHMVQSPFSQGGPFNCTLYRDPQVFPPPQIIYTGTGEVSLPFVYYLPCADAANAIVESALPSFVWNIQDDRLSITSMDGTLLGHVTIMDASGSIINATTVNSDRTTFDLAKYSPGLYLIVREGKSSRAAQRFILN
jgi:hypothetical protein